MNWIHLPLELLREAKVNGFSDEQISRIMNDGNEEDVYEKRKAPVLHGYIKWWIPVSRI